MGWMDLWDVGMWMVLGVLFVVFGVTIVTIVTIVTRGRRVTHLKGDISNIQTRIRTVDPWIKVDGWEKDIDIITI